MEAGAEASLWPSSHSLCAIPCVQFFPLDSESRSAFARQSRTAVSRKKDLIAGAQRRSVLLQDQNKQSSDEIGPQPHVLLLAIRVVCTSREDPL